MKTFSTPPASLLLTLLLSLLAGCGGASDPVVHKSHSEHDFAADPSLRLEVSEVGVIFLEPKDALAASSGDTGLLGTDEYPLRVAEQTPFTYTMDTSDDTIAMVRMIRLPGNEELFVIDAAQPRATVTLEPGDYKLVVYSGYTVASASGETNRAVFLENNTSTPTPTQAAMNASVPPKRVLAADTATQMLLSSKRCIECDLSGANLTRANLSGANLSFSNLKGADLSFSNLKGANLSGAYLKDADMNNSNLSTATLTNAVLAGANLVGAFLIEIDLQGLNMVGANLMFARLARTNLTSANLTGAYLNYTYLAGLNLKDANLTNALLISADLTSAKLSGANLSGANLKNATLTGATLSGAHWINGVLCAANSIGVCN